MNLNYILVAICFIPLVLYLIKLRNFKLTVKKMVVIAMFSGISFILGNITFIQYPQGGGISLLPSLPILLIGLIYSPVEGRYGCKLGMGADRGPTTFNECLPRLP